MCMRAGLFVLRGFSDWGRSVRIQVARSLRVFRVGPRHIIARSHGSLAGPTRWSL